MSDHDMIHLDCCSCQQAFIVSEAETPAFNPDYLCPDCEEIANRCNDDDEAIWMSIMQLNPPDES
jgi:hypothetical protein